MIGSAENQSKLNCSGFHLQVPLFFSSNNNATILDKDLSVTSKEFPKH